MILVGMSIRRPSPKVRLAISDRSMAKSALLIPLNAPEWRGLLAALLALSRQFREVTDPLPEPWCQLISDSRCLRVLRGTIAEFIDAMAHVQKKVEEAAKRLRDAIPDISAQQYPKIRCFVDGNPYQGRTWDVRVAWAFFQGGSSEEQRASVHRPDSKAWETFQASGAGAIEVPYYKVSCDPSNN